MEQGRLDDRSGNLDLGSLQGTALLKVDGITRRLKIEDENGASGENGKNDE
jgi:hypothetical protein